MSTDHRIMRSTEQLTLDPRNTRKHGSRNLAAVRASLKEFGQQQPLLVDKRGVVICGNGRLEAMRQLGWEEAWVEVTNLTGAEALAYAVADNRTAELAEWDYEELAQQLAALKQEEKGDQLITAAGWKLDEIRKRMGAAVVPSSGEDPGAGEKPVEITSKPGDLWHLGDHRLLCGDSTNAEHVERLMNREQAHLMATDPPYLVGYRAENHAQNWGDGKSKGEHWDDFQGTEETIEFFVNFLSVALLHCVPDVPVYQWHAHKRAPEVVEAWKRSGLLIHQEIIWAKLRPVMGRSHFSWQHEPCMYGWPQGSMPGKDRRPTASATTIWNIDQKGEVNGIHLTQKPIEICIRPITYHTFEGEVVYEPFSGSGTCIAAAEQLGRRCYAMELEPGNVDVAVRRWEQMTRRRAERE